MRTLLNSSLQVSWLAALLIATGLGIACQDPSPPQCPDGKCPAVDRTMQDFKAEGKECEKSRAHWFAEHEIDLACKRSLAAAGQACRGTCETNDGICHLTHVLDPEGWNYTPTDDRSCEPSGKGWTATYQGIVSCTCACLN